MPMKTSDSARTIIEAKLREKNLEMRPLSLQLGRNHAYLQQFLRRGKPAHLPEDIREALAKLIDVPEADLKPIDTKSDSSALVTSYSTVLKKVPLPMVEEFPRDLPILGKAVGGDGGCFEINGEVVDYARRLPRLMGVKEAYGVYVYGGSMSPWRKEGEIACVHPNVPVRVGDYVVVQIRPDHEGDAPRAYVKQLVRRTEADLILSQLDPAKEFSVPMATVLSIHRIIDWTELLLS